MVNPVYCIKCKQPLDLSDVFCRHCGADQRPPSQQPSPPQPTIQSTLQMQAASPAPLLSSSVPIRWIWDEPGSMWRYFRIGLGLWGWFWLLLLDYLAYHNTGG